MNNTEEETWWLNPPVHIYDRIRKEYKREEKTCRCGRQFIPERMGHYLCNECFERQTSRAIKPVNMKWLK